MKMLRAFVLWWLAASVLLVSAAQAQGTTASTAPPPFKAEELDALLELASKGVNELITLQRAALAG